MGSSLTVIDRNPAIPSMRAMALALFPTLLWRHHGIGVLQGYVVENNEPEVRLHVWSKDLIKPGMETSGDIHDHRFDLVSHVLCGVVGHEEIFPIANDSGSWSMLALTHARAAKESAYHGPTTPLAGRFTVKRETMAIKEGSTYWYPRGHFHRSPLAPFGIVTVTCVEKHRQSDEPARILYPTNVPPVMAFGHEMDWSVIGPVLKAAQASLRL